MNDEVKLEFEEDKIIIKYKDYIIKMNKEDIYTFGDSDNVKDINNKKINLIDWTKIRNYIYKNSEKIDKEINKDRECIDEKDIIDKFQGIRELKDDNEKKKILNKFYNTYYMIMAAIFFGIFGLIAFILKSNDIEILIGKIMFSTFFLLGIYAALISLKIKKEAKIYIAKAQSYARQNSYDYEAGKNYEVKITDGKNTYLNRWFPIDKKNYDNKIIYGNIYLVKINKRTDIYFIEN